MTARTEADNKRRALPQTGKLLYLLRQLRKRIAPEGSLRYSFIKMARHMAQWCCHDVPRRVQMIELLGRSPLVLVCEKPDLATIEEVSGFTPIRGWALSKSAVSHICIFVDDVFMGEAFYGFRRHDVPYSNKETGSNSGFAFRLDTSILSRGFHTVKILASSSDGNTATLEGKLKVIRKVLPQSRRPAVSSDIM